MLFCIVSSGSVTNFFPTVVSTLGYNDVITLLLTAPPYVLAVIATWVNAWHADKTGERYFHVVLPLWISVVAFILAATTSSLTPRYVAMMLMVSSPHPLSPREEKRKSDNGHFLGHRTQDIQVSSVYSSYVVVLAWISNTIPRPPAKRAAALAFINAVSNASSIFTSYLYPDSAAPAYIVAFIVNSITAFIGICAATMMRVILVRLNKKLESGVYVPGAINGAPGRASKNGFRFKV